MNEKKICFISCVNDHELYQEALFFINQLEVPEGYEIECISIENAESMAQGYNEAMKASDAKYKVYLHQDVYIRNRFFIRDILNIFKSNDSIGMIGVVGSRIIPTNGIWWESISKCGKVFDSHTSEMQLWSFNDAQSEYDIVQAIDGLIMITQYDIPWREDIFDGWHFYDISQCLEFSRRGYKVAIPRQEQPWVIHDCGVVNVRNGYEEYRKFFLKEYSKEIFPLVSILIPAYNQTRYLKEALESAINQTYLNIEIIIGDDSTNNEVEEFVKPYLEKYENIHYFKNERTEMDYGISNIQMLLKKSKGEYVNYLFHDDIFHITKVEKMMNYFLAKDNISFITSHRQLIDQDGKHLPDNEATKRIFDKDTLINGNQLGLYCLGKLTNFIGEPTTVLFKKSLLERGFGYFNKNSYSNIADMATWLSLLQKGNAIYICDSLSYFRQHSSQNSQKIEVYLMGISEWKNIIDDSYRTGIIDSKSTYKELVSNWFYLCNPVIRNISYKDIDENLKVSLKKAFKDAIDIIFTNNNYYESKNVTLAKNKIPRKLAILDDVFPNLLTGFRIAEYNYYLENIKETNVYSEDINYAIHIEEYLRRYPQFKGSIHQGLMNVKTDEEQLFYTVFLNNIYRYLPLIEKLEMPFVFTLYPGGGLWLHQRESDYKLQKVCSSSLLRKVIVTQKITYDYLIDMGFVNEDKIEFIYGGVIPSDYYKKMYKEKHYYNKNKKTFDICFVANKYMEKGIDKGYDVFIDVCKALTKISDDIFFHVVGGFNEHDISIESLENRIKFYGTKYLEFFPDFYSKMDIILSPNKSFVLYPGSFDGFPTGCCVEAAFAGVAVFCTDDLNNNIAFKNNEEICIINRNVHDIVDKVMYYYSNTDELYDLSLKGKQKALEVFDIHKQMEQRVNLLKQYLEN